MMERHILRRRGTRRLTRPLIPTLLAGLSITITWGEGATGQAAPETPAIGRAAVDALTFDPLEFEQPVVAHHSVGGVRTLLLTDRALPLVTVHAYFRGGYGLFDRDVYAAAMGLPAMLRFGGTERRSPLEVDEAAEQIALQLSFGSGGGSITSTMNTLREHLEEALGLWGDMLARPGFAQAEIDAWRARELESVLRRVDDPARLAYSELNRLLYGDHPVGWEMSPDDLAPERVSVERFRRVHARIACREHLILGVTGDTSWDEIRPMLAAVVDALPECADDLPEEPAPEIRRAPGVFLLHKEIEQSVIAMAHPASVRFADDPQYFAAMIGNSILGGGGFSSRMMGRVRTEEGYAYSAASLWTTPRRHDGLIGATTRTRPDRVAQTLEVILETMSGLRSGPPTSEEVSTTVDQMVNGFVFNFDSPSQVVARTMYYLALDLPEDWLEIYLRGIQRVSPDDVHRVFANQLRPAEMSILIVGDSARMDLEALGRIGPVTLLPARHP